MTREGALIESFTWFLHLQEHVNVSRIDWIVLYCGWHVATTFSNSLQNMHGWLPWWGTLQSLFKVVGNDSRRPRIHFCQKLPPHLQWQWPFPCEMQRGAGWIGRLGEVWPTQGESISASRRLWRISSAYLGIDIITKKEKKTGTMLWSLLGRSSAKNEFWTMLWNIFFILWQKSSSLYSTFSHW